MAVTKVAGGTVLRLKLQTGEGEGGSTVYRLRSFSNVKPEASDQDLYDVAEALAGLQEYPLGGILRIDTSQLVQE